LKTDIECNFDGFHISAIISIKIRFFLQFFDVHSDFEVFRKLPDTMRRMADRLMDSDSVLNQHTVGTLNSSHPTDLKLMGELQMIQDVINTVCALVPLL
jgi:hypothetical protein